MKTAYEIISSLSIIDQQGIKLSFIQSVTVNIRLSRTLSMDTLRRRSAISIDLECMMKVNKPQLFRDWSKSIGGGGPEHLEMWLIKNT